MALLIVSKPIGIREKNEFTTYLYFFNLDKVKPLLFLMALIHPLMDIYITHIQLIRNWVFVW